MQYLLKTRHACMALAALTTLTLGSAAWSADKLYAPYVTKGELELEYFGSATVDNNEAKDNAQKHKFAVGYGVNDYWFTEIYANLAKGAQDNVQFDNVEWENIFQLTERGEYWADVGASIAYEWSPKTSEADTIEGRLLFAKDIDKTSHILNLIGEKDLGSGPKAAFEGKALWSSRYRYSEAFEPGFEIRSDFGELKDAGSFNDQSHSIGPAAYGKIPLGLTKDHADGMKYRVGYLFGVSDAAADGDAFVQLEYELHF